MMIETCVDIASHIISDLRDFKSYKEAIVSFLKSDPEDEK
jgi:uncharacterized protein YutE (UPF0331/DUF86 family)